MRPLILCTLLTILAGCRSPQATYYANINHASTQLISTMPVEQSNDNNLFEYSVEELVQIGLQNSPTIVEAQHRIQMLSYRIPQELSLPDPVVNTTTHLAPVETAAGRQSFALGISQKVVNVDRRAVKASIAHEEVLAAQANLSKIEKELAEQIRVACFQLLAVKETIRITQEDLESLAQIEAVVLRQYEVKKSVSQQDVLNVQVEQSKVENQLTTLQQKEKSFSARLARLVHLPQRSTFHLTDRLLDIAPIGEVNELMAQALQARPELEAQLAQVRRDQRKVCLANLQNRPDFTVGLNWIATDSAGISPVANGDDALLLGIGFNLPIFKNRIRAAACEASESKMASTARLSALQDQISEEVFDTFFKLESISSTLTLLQEDILPKSERTLSLSIEEYSTGKTDFTEMIANWRALLRYRISVADLQAQQMQLLAVLGRQVGQLEPIQSNEKETQLEHPPFEDTRTENSVDTSRSVSEFSR